MSRYAILSKRYEVVMAYRRLFLDEDGRVKPDARTVFADIHQKIGLNGSGPLRDQTGRIDPAAHVYRDGAKALVDHMNQRVTADPSEILNDMKAAEER